MRLDLESSQMFGTLWQSGRWSGLRKILSGNFNLVAGGPPVYFFDPDGSNRNIVLPDAYMGGVFFLLNVGGLGDLAVKSSLGVTVSQIHPGEGVAFLSSTDEWKALATSGTGKSIRVVTAAGVITQVDTDDVILVNKSVGAATTVDLQSSATRPTDRSVKIVDLKGDSDVNPITIVPNGLDTIVGLSSWVINFSKGSTELWPIPGGGGWYQ